MELTYSLTPDKVAQLQEEAPTKKGLSEERLKEIKSLPRKGRKVTIQATILDLSLADLIDRVGEEHARLAMLIGVKRKVESKVRSLMEQNKPDAEIQTILDSYVPEFGTRGSGTSQREKYAQQLAGKSAEEMQAELVALQELIAAKQAEEA